MSSEVLWGIGLLLAGIALGVIEIFVPSGGIIALAAGVTALAGVVAFWMEGPMFGLSSLGVLLIITPLMVHMAIKVMPNTPFGRALILGDDDDEENSAKRTAEDRERTERERALIGAEGEAETDLRPVGTAIIEGARLEVLSEEGLIEAGARVRITRVEGQRVRVRAI